MMSFVNRATDTDLWTHPSPDIGPSCLQLFIFRLESFFYYTSYAIFVMSAVSMNMMLERRMATLKIVLHRFIL